MLLFFGQQNLCTKIDIAGSDTECQIYFTAHIRLLPVNTLRGPAPPPAGGQAPAYH